jgi:uncharacterized membrane-anchored protein
MAIPVYLGNNNEQGPDGQVSLASTTSSSSARYVNAAVATVIGTISLALIVASSFTCRFISITSTNNDLLAITSYSQQITQSSTSIGLFCPGDFYYISEETDTKLLLGQVCASSSIVFGAFVVVLLWSVVSGIATCINNRVARIWRLISLLTALCAVIQIPIFLIYQIRPCTDFQNQQFCSMDVGSYTLICSITGWIMVTIITQFLDAPTSEWYERFEEWKLSSAYENVNANDTSEKREKSTKGRSKYRNLVPGFPTSHRLVRTRTDQQSLSSSSSGGGSHISEFLLRPLQPRSNETATIDESTNSLLTLWKSAAPHVQVPPSECVTSSSCLSDRLIPPPIHEYCFKSAQQGQKETRTYSNIPFPVLEDEENGMPLSPSDDYNDDEESIIINYNPNINATSSTSITNEVFDSGVEVISIDAMSRNKFFGQQSSSEENFSIPVATVDNDHEISGEANVEIESEPSVIGANLSRVSDAMENVLLTVTTPLFDDNQNYHRSRSDAAVVASRSRKVEITKNDGGSKEDSQESQDSLGSLEPTIRSISPDESLLDNEESKTRGNRTLRNDSRSPSPVAVDPDNFLSLSLEGMDLPEKLRSEILFANTSTSETTTDLLAATNTKAKPLSTIDNKRQLAKSWLEQRKSKRMTRISNKGGYSVLLDSGSSSVDDSNPKGTKVVAVSRSTPTVSKPPMQMITITKKDDTNVVAVHDDSLIGTSTTDTDKILVKETDKNVVVSSENSGIFSRQAGGYGTGASPINSMDSNDNIDEDADPEPHLHWSDDESDDDSLGTDMSITSEHSDDVNANNNSTGLDNIGTVRITRKSTRGTRGRRRRRGKKKSSVASVSSLISFTIEEETQDDLVDDVEPPGMDKYTNLVKDVHEHSNSKNKQQDLNISMITDNSPATAVNTSYNEESTNERSGQSSNTESVITRTNIPRLSYGTEFRGRILDDNLEAMTGINSRPHRVEIFSSTSHSISSKNSKEDSSASASTPKSSQSLPTPMRKHRQLTRPGVVLSEGVHIVTPPRKRHVRIAQSPPVLITKLETRSVRIRVSGLRKKRTKPLFVVEREVRLGLHAPGQTSSDEEEGEQVDVDDYNAPSQHMDTLDVHDNSSLSSGSASSSKLRIQRMRKRQAMDALNVIKNRRLTSMRTTTPTSSSSAAAATTASKAIVQSNLSNEIQRSLLNLVNPVSSHSSDVPSYDASSLNYSADTNTAFTMDLSASVMSSTIRSSLTRYLPALIDDDNVRDILTNNRVQYDDRICVSPELTTLSPPQPITTTLSSKVDAEGRYESTTQTRSTMPRDNDDIREKEALSSSSASSASFPNTSSSHLYISPDRSDDDDDYHSIV